MYHDEDRPKTYSGMRASQMTFEIEALIGAARGREINARSYLEIGARHGDTFHAIMSNLPDGSKGLAVDMPGGLWGVSSSTDFLERAVDNLRRNGRPDTHFLFADSQSKAGVELVREWQKQHLGGAAFDLALIDGDHTLAGVSRDWFNFARMCRFVAFHDIVGADQSEKVHGNPVQVPTLWAGIKGFEPAACLEFVAPGSKMGIGLVDVAAWLGGVR